MSVTSREVAKNRLAHPIIRARVEQNIQNYAGADRSDPFTAARCAAHYRTGICNPLYDNQGREMPMDYEAIPTKEEGTVEGRGGEKLAVTRIVYKNIRRP